MVNPRIVTGATPFYAPAMMRPARRPAPVCFRDFARVFDRVARFAVLLHRPFPGGGLRCGL